MHRPQNDMKDRDMHAEQASPQPLPLRIQQEQKRPEAGLCLTCSKEHLEASVGGMGEQVQDEKMRS